MFGYIYILNKRLMWTTKEIKKLEGIYPDKLNHEIAELLGKTTSAVSNKAGRLGLRKSKALRTKISNDAHAIRVKKGGRDLSEDNLRNIATKYKTRVEFIINDNPAYRTALRLGILSDICQHMVPMNFSTPQLILRDILDSVLGIKSRYNDRDTIKPYEIDVYYPTLKLAFEYQGKYWHRNDVNNNDSLKKELILNMGITPIYIYEYGRDYESDLKHQLIKHLPIINSVLGREIREIAISDYKVSNIYKDLYDLEDLIVVAKGFTTLSEFRNSERTVYRKLTKMGKIREATSHMKNRRLKVKLSDDGLISVIDQYDNLTDFRVEQLPLYKHIMRVGKEHLITHLKSKPLFTLDVIMDTVNRYHRKCEFSNDNPKMYKFIRRNGLTHLLSGLNNCR